MRRKLTALAIAVIAALAPQGAAGDVCPPLAAGQGTADGPLCPHVMRLRCPDTGRNATGFWTEVDGELGVVTALHAVIDCPDGGIRDFETDQTFSIARVDTTHDAALLRGTALPSDWLETAPVGSASQFRIIGYPLGLLRQSGIYLDAVEPLLAPLSDVVASTYRQDLAERNSPELGSDVLQFVGEMNKGHSGAPVLTEDGHAVAFGDGGNKSIDSDLVWAIPLNALSWSEDVATARAQLAGKTSPVLASFLDAPEVPGLPKLLFVDAFERLGSIYLYDAGQQSIHYEWGESTIYSLVVHPDGEAIVFVNANDFKVFELRNDRVTVLYTHDTYVRDVAFDPVGRLYFSEASGAGADGKIYRLDAGKATVKYDIAINDITGFWAGDFAFDADGHLWLSSGNKIPAVLFENVRDLGVNRQVPRYTSTTEPIKGFAFIDEDTIAYTNFQQGVRTLHVPTSTPGPGFTLGTAEHLSDVAVLRGSEVTDTTNAQPKSDAGAILGYLVVPGWGFVQALEDVRSGTAICGAEDDFRFLVPRAPQIASADQLYLGLGDMAAWLETELCKGWLVRDKKLVSRVLGDKTELYTMIEIRGD